MVAPDRFYMLPHGEICYTDPGTVWESEIEPFLYEGDSMNQGPWEVEERLVESIEKSIRDASWVIEDIIEWCVDDIGCDDPEAAGFDDIVKDPEVLYAAETLRSVIISKVRWWNAGAKVGTHTITLEVDGPYLDGEPLYRPVAKP